MAVIEPKEQNKRNCTCCKAGYVINGDESQVWQEIPFRTPDKKEWCKFEGLCEFCNPKNNLWYQTLKKCHKNKVIDAFTFFNELDLLQLRFEILNDYVDKFILVESHQTFSGNPKPLYYLENKERFAKWNDKIIHIVVPNIEVTDGNLFQRHYLCYETIENKLLEFNKNDVAFCSDLDEIWNPEILFRVDNKPHSLIQHNYSYYLNYLSNEEWTGTLVTQVKNIFVGFNKHNRTAKPFPLENGGWHWSNQGGVEQIIKKLEAYDHSNEVLPVLSQFEGYGIKDRMEKGYDFLGRPYNYQGVPFAFTVSEKEWPQYLRDNKNKWKHLCK